jgi:CRP-like cAMP-binding protein
MDEADHSLRSITDAIVLDISFERLDFVIRHSPCLAKAFTRTVAVDSAMARERLLGLGQRNARERFAHLICELFWRLRQVALTDGMSMDFPVTQEELGSAIGVSTVHANRMVQDLKSLGLIALHGHKIEVRSQEDLEKLALFNPNFLRLVQPGSKGSADRPFCATPHTYHLRPDKAYRSPGALL